MFKQISLAAAVIACGAASTVQAYDCEYSREITRELNVAQLSDLEVDAGAGSLDIIGYDSADVISIEARLCADDKSVLKEMDVTARTRSNRAMIATQIPESSGWYSGGQRSIDLTVRVPSRMNLEVSDSSGRAKIRRVASLEIDDSSGALHISEIKGDVEVEDSSGAIELQDIGGNVEVDDSSGAIRARDIGGTFHVSSDSSGEIDGRRIKGDYIVDRDSSGSITARDVGGDFTVKRDGSGGIYYEDIVGKVDIPERKRQD